MEKHNFLVRMHNLPRNSSLCQILHFIWETVDFEPDEALVRAYSANDAIIGFVNKKFADETGFDFLNYYFFFCQKLICVSPLFFSKFPTVRGL